MKIREIMTRNVETVRPEHVIQEAASKMKSLDVGSLPVCDNRKLLGMITDRDITVRAVADGRNPGITPVQDAMTPGVTYCYDDQDVSEAAKLMKEHQIRRLPIVNRQHELVGIVALGDLAVDGDRKMSGKVLEQVSEPAEPDR
jgi:CBS domain-containing protein